MTQKQLPLNKFSDVILERLTKLHPKLIDLSLGRVERLLDRLGNPHQRLPPIVHVAGTNGKGSVIAFLRAFLEGSGYSVHVHTSPHLVRFNERIRLAGKLIEEEALSKLLEECEVANGGEPITYFEITTAAALLAFANTPGDIVLLETGLGGRLDATNVIEKPLLTVITPISLDHQQFLGDTVSAIAQEKAGIFKQNIPVICAAQDDDVFDVMDRRAQDLNAELIYENKDWKVSLEGDGFTFSDKQGQQKFRKPRLAGDHQFHNAAQAIACARNLKSFTISNEAIAEGLQTVEWPARLQQLYKGPLVESLPNGWELWLDGGHNTAAATATSQEAQKSWADAPLYLIFGMLNTKEPADFLSVLASQVQELKAVMIPGEPATLSAEESSKAATLVGINASSAISVKDAIQQLAAAPIPRARILICGSLYLAGTVLGENA
jgi:dihydrofolate synthase/folylpolyglutamate synthase